jgi:GntR family transcriptional regulator, transcriptional repressor for pyruvate dehydrogenase complex
MSYQFGSLFNSVRTGKVSELIAQQIKNTILTGVMKPGERLPSERELVERFEASRNSVREALKILEVSGLLLIKRGSGVFVTDGSPRSVSDSFSSILKMGNVSINDLTQARIVFEPGTARLACENIQENDFLKLEENVRRASEIVRSGLEAVELNVMFHVLVAEATHNTVVSLTMNTLIDVVKEASVKIVNSTPQAFPGSGKAVKHHIKILKAFRQKDSQRAYNLMLEHILEIQEALIKFKKAEQ